MNNISPIFQFLKEKSDAGLKTALVTLIAVTGASTRNPGAHMAVAADGSFVGSFSGGCVETAVVAEALEAIAENAPREVRFGEGSPYLDIRLPCGGGIDLLFSPIASSAIIDEIFTSVENRQPISISMNCKNGEIQCSQEKLAERVARDGDIVRVNHLPAATVVILGHGASVESLAKLTESYGIECEVFTPDADIVGRISNNGGLAVLLKTPAANDRLKIDPWTAYVFYFHDHDWEAELMKQALESSAYYVGAMGSLKTHANRTLLLEDAGVSAGNIARMVAPIGLIPSTRDPATLALSTLSQIVESYHRQFQR